MRYYLIAGEASGDLHGSLIMESLLKEDSDAQFRFWGGDLMSSISGGEGLVRHYKETAVMGLVEVLSKLDKIAKNLALCKKDIISWNPDVIIFIDYPGFNLRIAKFAKENDFTTFYYIAPKVWARGESRIKLLKRYIDKLYIIFPFELNYFKKHNINALYFGNPIYEHIVNHCSNHESREEFFKRTALEDKPTIALLAGSRKNEINYLLPRFLKLEKLLPDYQFVLAGVSSIDSRVYNNHLENSQIKLLFGETYSILKHSTAAAISSGTASLEAAITETPQVVCYGVNPITALIAKLIIKIKYVSLVNLILNREAVKELLQWDCTPNNIYAELNKIVKGGKRKSVLSSYKKVKRLIHDKDASLKIAKSMINELKKIQDGHLFVSYLESPLGLLKLICNNTHLLEIHRVEEMDDQPYDKENQDHPIITETKKQLIEYFEESRHQFDLPIKLNGTKFQNLVWQELVKIPYGQIKTYGEVATLVNSKEASRAVGLACKMNPLLIVVPCHRVIGSNKKLTGFAIGLDKKSYLLDLEKVHINIDKNLFTQNNAIK